MKRKIVTWFWLVLYLFMKYEVSAAKPIIRSRLHDRKTFRSEAVHYWNQPDSVRLAGTLTIPERPNKRFPVVVLISGSGLDDRDYSVHGYKPFKEMAEYLSERGIAVLRADDRGKGESTWGRIPGMPATIEEMANDIQAAVDYLRQRPDIDTSQIGLLGHSEGGAVAPMVAARTPVAFVVSLAGIGLTGAQNYKAQTHDMLVAEGVDSVAIQTKMTYFIDPLVAVYLKHLDEKQYVDTVRQLYSNLKEKLDSTTRRQVFFGLEDKIAVGVAIDWGYSEWLMHLLAIDPSIYWQQVHCPVLALFGSKDVQVNAHLNAAALEHALAKGNKATYKILILPGLNHLYQKAGTGSPKEYAALGKPFPPEIIDTVYRWMSKVLKHKHPLSMAMH